MTVKKQFKNIIFDVGDVLLSYRWKEMLMDYGLDENEAQKVGELIFDDDEKLWTFFDLGTVSEEELIAMYAKKHPTFGEVIGWFIRHGEFMHVPRPKVWKRVHELKQKGYGIYILSNYSEVLFNKHTRYADFLEDADGILVSYMVNKIKPDFAIYEELLNRFSLKKEECIFFDDRKENVDAANDFGIHAVRVLSQEGLLKDLEMFG